MDDWYLRVHEFLYLKEDEGSDEEARFIAEALGLREGTRVLDAPCAAGRIGRLLAHAGCLVTEVDINRGFLALARKRFQEESVPGSFCAMDLRRLALRPAFDAAINWWASFGYFSDADNLQALREMARVLVPGGRVAIEQPNRQWVLRHFVAGLEFGPWRLLSRWDAAGQRMESTWVLTEAGKTKVYPMSMRWYTLTQFRRLFRRAGLELEAAYGAYDRTPYRASSPRLIVVGRKPS